MHPSDSAQAIVQHQGGLAGFLRRHRDEIVAEWTDHVSHFPHARKLEHPRLRDEIPDLISRIADHVEAGGHPGESLAEVPDGHALDRLDVGFDLSEITLEYAELRRCVLRALGREGREEPALDERIRLHECLDHATHVAVTRYMRARHRTLEGLDRVTAVALESGQDLDGFLVGLLRVTVTTTESVDAAAILLREGQVLRVRAAHGVDAARTQGTAIPIGEGFLGRVALERRPLATRDTGTPLQATYGIPLLRGEELVGVAWLGSLSAPEFSREDMLLFRTMAHRATAIIGQQRAQQALIESEERHRLATETAGLGTWERNLVTGELGLTERARQVFAIEPAVDVGWELLLSRVHPEDREKVTRLHHACEPGAPLPEVEAEYRVVHPDGAVRWVSSRVRVVRDDGPGLRCVGTVLDITTRHEAEAALRRRDAELREALRARDEVLHIVSHDLKNPLGVIVLNAALIARLAASGKSDDARVGRAADATRRAAARMQRLIGDLLQVSAIDARRLGVSLAEVDLCGIAREAADSIGPQGEQRGVTIGLELPGSEVRVLADRERILQVLENLLGNALQHTPAGGRVTLRVARGSDAATCEVEDTGPGVPPERIPHLFERYYQGVERKGVAGLGLYIARGIVETHGGRIGLVSSSSGRGALFRFTLPLA